MKNKINKKYISIAIVGAVALSCFVGFTNSKSKGEEVVVNDVVEKVKTEPKDAYVIPPIVPSDNGQTAKEVQEATTNVNFDESLNTANSIVLTNTNKESIVAKSQANSMPSEPSYSASNVAKTTTSTTSTVANPPARTEANTKGPITDPNDPNYDPMKDPTRKPDGTPIAQDDLSKTDSNVKPPTTSTGGGSSSSSNNSSTPKEGDINDKGQIYDGVFGWMDISTGSTISGGEDLGGSLDKQVGIMD